MQWLKQKKLRLETPFVLISVCAFFSGKIPSYVGARLTARYWVPYLLRFATIYHYSPLFETIRHYPHYSRLFPLFVLFASRYSGLSAIRYLNNRVFLSRNYRLIVAPRKFDVLKTNICPRSEASRTNMLVLRTSNFQGATIRPIVPRHKHSIVFIVHH